MDNRQDLNDIYLYIIIGVVAIIDILLITYFHEKLNYEFPNILVTDITTILVAGFLGKLFALKNDFPIWWHKNRSQKLIVLFIIGLIIILTNTLIYYCQNTALIVPWFDFSNYKEPIFISLRAGLQEEIIYRLFIFSLIVFVVKKVIDSKKASIIIGMVISALIFGIGHSGFYWAFINGLILSYVYYSYGLIPAILIHILADAVPFTLLFSIQNIY